MAPKAKNKPVTAKKPTKPPSTPTLIKRDPSLPLTLPSTSIQRQPSFPEQNEEPIKKRFLKYIYNRDKKTYCDRTCMSWACIIGYSIMYLLFLATYTMVFLYGSLVILKYTEDYSMVENVLMLTYSKKGVGITATPTSENLYPIISYRSGDSSDYERYIQAIDRLLLVSRKKIDVDILGPCGRSPYGYGERPCVLLRINRQWKWTGKPLQMNSTKTKLAPTQVQEWIHNNSKMLWFHCSGYHSYDKEHIGRLNYYPYPPGIDPEVFPLDSEDISPLIAVQISNFTLGVSLAIECELWYENGPSSVEFVLFVM